MDELLPVLVSRMTHPRDAVSAIQAALRGGIDFISLEEPPSYDGPHALELHAPTWTEPLVLLAEPAGEALGTQFPLTLRPLADEHRLALVALLLEAGVPYEELPPPPARSIVPEAHLGEIAFHESAPPVHESAPPVHESAPPVEERPSMLPSALLGRVLGGGKYAIEAQLGSGGMGRVYRARHVMLDKACAVKVLHPSHRHNEEFLAAFHREALAASRLDHPNVVRVMDFGREPNGLLYIAMELCDGRDLRQILSDEPVQPLDRIVDVMVQVGAALSASHAEDIVHRDIKPENIILVPRRDDDGTIRDAVKVLDFGIAEIMGKQAEPDGEGPKRQVAGTPDYMAPEQIRGIDIDARTDVYACGVILYEMATGKVPFFDATTPEAIAWMHLNQEPPKPSEIHPDIDRRLEALILKALCKDPAGRHQSARELRADLRALVEPTRTATPASTRYEPVAGLRQVDTPDAFDDFMAQSAGPLERSDAIDIGDMLGLDGSARPKPAVAKEQAWVLGEQLATALLQDPAAPLAKIEAVADPAVHAHEMAMLERAMASIATRGAGAQLAVVVTHLVSRARGAAPGTDSREALAARALLALAKPELLLTLADQVLGGPPAERDPARRVLLVLGPAGAEALAAARERGSIHGAAWAGRPRFVAAMRDLAAGQGATAVSRTVGAYVARSDGRDPALLEDLLRAVPEVANEPLGTLLSSRDVRHPAPAVRRAAAAALAAAWGGKANAWIAPLIEDPDDGVRIAALGALRKHGGVDREAVRRIGRVLTNALPAGTEAKVAAAAALGDTAGPARALAVELLTQMLTPAGSGFLTKLVTAEVHEDALVTLTAARTLLAIAGPAAVRVIEARAAKASPNLRRELSALLASPAAR